MPEFVVGVSISLAAANVIIGNQVASIPCLAFVCRRAASFSPIETLV